MVNMCVKNKLGYGYNLMPKGVSDDYHMFDSSNNVENRVKLQKKNPSISVIIKITEFINIDLNESLYQ